MVIYFFNNFNFRNSFAADPKSGEAREMSQHIQQKSIVFKLAIYASCLKNGSNSQTWASAGGSKTDIFPLEIATKKQQFLENLNSKINSD